MRLMLGTQVWLAGLEIEASRALRGNAVYRDLIQALVMVDIEHLVLAVRQAYRYKTGARGYVSAAIMIIHGCGAGYLRPLEA